MATMPYPKTPSETQTVLAERQNEAYTALPLSQAGELKRQKKAGGAWRAASGIDLPRSLKAPVT
jgi:hypothetical protein